MSFCRSDFGGQLVGVIQLDVATDSELSNDQHLFANRHLVYQTTLTNSSF